MSAIAKIVEIFEQEFVASNPCSRVIVHDSSRKYGRVTLSSSYSVFLSWRSDEVRPVLAFGSSDKVLWIGVDQRVACVEPQGTICFAIGLAAPILDLQQALECVLIICDSQVVVVNQDYSIRAVCDVANVPDAVEIAGDRLRVVFVDGQEETFRV
jgi:hypothetical protein